MRTETLDEIRSNEPLTAGQRALDGEERQPARLAEKGKKMKPQT
jgi:hypothetical protein